MAQRHRGTEAQRGKRPRARRGERGRKGGKLIVIMIVIVIVIERNASAFARWDYGVTGRGARTLGIICGTPLGFVIYYPFLPSVRSATLGFGV